MLPLQSNSYVIATSASADFVVSDTSATLHKEAANVMYDYLQQLHNNYQVNNNLAISCCN